MKETLKYRVTGLGFGIAVTAFLAATKGDLLYHMAQFSMFIPKREFLVTFMEQPGGLLSLAGAFLTQFCHIPVIGAAITALCLCLLAYLVRRTFRLDGDALPLAYIPALMMLLFITRLDYSVYTMRSYGMLFSQILGLSAGTALTAAYRKWLASSRLGVVYIPLTAILGYPLLGIYALLPGLMISISEKERRFMNLALTIFCAGAIPAVCAFIPGLYERINSGYTYLAGMPFLDFPDELLSGICPVLLAILSVLMIPFVAKASMKFSIPAALGAMALFALLTNWDSDFKTTLAMERAAAEERWNDVISLAKHSDRQTRSQVLYRNIALSQTGRLTEEMFAYPYGREAMGTSIDLAFICAAPVLHYCGMVNSCDRLAMEASTSFTKNIFYTKLFARDALARGEMELAEKYVDIVASNWFEGRWVRRHRSFLAEPERMAKDATFSSILALMKQESTEFDVVEPVEMMIRRYFSKPDYVNEQVYEWQMATMLAGKDVQTPIYCMFNRQDMFPTAHITKGIAEAMALLVSMNGDRDLMVSLVEVLQSQKNMLKKFSSFSNDINRMDDLKSDKARDYFIKQYGRSYWTYYYFIDEN
ncbi:MAG: DUF6057 family protein [Bacteroidales bacterium]|nr:DUF6057 family protein [Bacteroidales bacterium]